MPLISPPYLFVSYSREAKPDFPNGGKHKLVCFAVSLALGNEVIKQTSVPVLSHGAAAPLVTIYASVS